MSDNHYKSINRIILYRELNLTIVIISYINIFKFMYLAYRYNVQILLFLFCSFLISNGLNDYTHNVLFFTIYKVFNVILIIILL